MSKLQMLSLTLALMASLLAVASGAPSPAPSSHVSNPTSCPAVAPVAGFEASLLDGEWIIPNGYVCHKMWFRSLPGNRGEMGYVDIPILNSTFVINTPGKLERDAAGSPVMEYTLIQAKAEEYLIFYVCIGLINPHSVGGFLLTLVRSSADLQEVTQQIDAQLVMLGSAAPEFVRRPVAVPCAASR